MIVHDVVGAVLISAGRLLLGLRTPGRRWCPDVWDVLGGHIEPGELPEQALVRELREELGITPTRWLELETLTDIDQERGERLECRFYLVLAWSGTPANLQPAEHAALEWLSLEQAARRPLAHPSYPALFARALELAAAQA